MLKRDELTNPNSCMSRAHADEMTFVLLGRDVAAPAAIRAWVRARIAAGKNKLDDPQIQEALNCIGAMQDGHTDVELDNVHKAADIMHEALDTIKRALDAWYAAPGRDTEIHTAYGAAILGLQADIARCRSFGDPRLVADTTTDANKQFRTQMPLTTMADVSPTGTRPMVYILDALTGTEHVLTDEQALGLRPFLYGKPPSPHILVDGRPVPVQSATTLPTIGNPPPQCADGGHDDRH